MTGLNFPAFQGMRSVDETISPVRSGNPFVRSYILYNHQNGSRGAGRSALKAKLPNWAISLPTESRLRVTMESVSFRTTTAFNNGGMGVVLMLIALYATWW